jgi:hypothetical protein
LLEQLEQHDVGHSPPAFASPVFVNLRGRWTSDRLDELENGLLSRLPELSSMGGLRGGGGARWGGKCVMLGKGRYSSAHTVQDCIDVVDGLHVTLAIGFEFPDGLDDVVASGRHGTSTSGRKYSLR